MVSLRPKSGNNWKQQTVIPVYTPGKVLDDVRVFEEYEGSIRITPLDIN